MKKNGFTLVELLAVIAILAMLIIIAVPNIASLLNKEENELSKISIENLGDAAVSYGIDKLFLKKCAPDFNPTSVDSTSIPGCSKVVKVSKIIEEGYFEDNKHVCDPNREVLIYRYINFEEESGIDIDEYRYYIDSDVCDVN